MLEFFLTAALILLEAALLLRLIPKRMASGDRLAFRSLLLFALGLSSGILLKSLDLGAIIAFLSGFLSPIAIARRYGSMSDKELRELSLYSLVVLGISLVTLAAFELGSGRLEKHRYVMILLLPALPFMLVYRLFEYFGYTIAGLVFGYIAERFALLYFLYGMRVFVG